MSEDSLVDDQDTTVQPSAGDYPQMSSQAGSGAAAVRSANLDEHIRSVKQKKEEADELRLQRFQEQLRKKEQKW